MERHAHSPIVSCLTRTPSTGRAFSEEFVFLDEHAAINSTWEDSSSRQYKVISNTSSKAVNNRKYRDVIEMEINTLDVDGSIRGTAKVLVR